MTFTIMFDAAEYNTVHAGTSSPTQMDSDMVKPYDPDVSAEDEGTLREDHDDSEYDEFKRSKSDKLCRLYLWYFLLELLSIEGTEKIISWTNKPTLEFKIHDTKSLALMWGNLHGRENMTYAKLSRALRYHYKKGVIRKVQKKRYCYQFLKCPKVRYVMEENVIKNKTKFNEKVKHEVLAQSTNNQNKEMSIDSTKKDEKTCVKSEIEEILQSLENSIENEAVCTGLDLNSQISVTSDESSCPSETENVNDLDISNTLKDMDFTEFFTQDSRTSEEENHSAQNIINELANELQVQVNQQTNEANSFQQQDELVMNYEQFSYFNTPIHQQHQQQQQQQEQQLTDFNQYLSPSNIPMQQNTFPSPMQTNFQTQQFNVFPNNVYPVESQSMELNINNELTFLANSIHLFNN